ncbi:hypothetical protein TM239_02410 [Bradyrhizobium sp. TM239]|nr:hypothetical protein TM239_02410 [Bradyrhizobium sp. TM239]
MVNRHGLLALAVLALSASTTANAYEFGWPGAEQKPGLVIGAAAAAPPPGLYGFDQVFHYQAKLVGPGAPVGPNGQATTVKGDVAAQGILWVPGWTFLGGTYGVVGVVPVNSGVVGSPINVTPEGVHNPFIANELSWRLGDSGFFVKAGLGIYVPIGTTTGFNKLESFGDPWWTFQPNLVISYLKDGWNLTVNLFDEIHTKNPITQYQSGDIFHAEFTATKSIGNWTFGPVGYYVGQITNDRSSAFYGNAINVNRYDIWAAGALVGYNFGPVQLNVWGTQEFSARASGGTAGPPGIDTAAVAKGFTAFAQLSYRLWAPEAPVSPTRPLYRK